MPPRSIWASEEEWERWEKAATGTTRNAWIRRALNSQAELDEALARVEAQDSGLSDKTSSLR